MSYDHWKTTNPDEQRDALPMDDQPTELDLAYDRIRQLENAMEEITADIKPELCASELELIVWWGRQVDRLQAIAREALTSTECNTP